MIGFNLSCLFAFLFILYYGYLLSSDILCSGAATIQSGSINCIYTQCSWWLMFPCICPFVVCISYYRHPSLFLLMDLFSSLIPVCRKSALYSLIGIKLPSQTVSIWYSHVSTSDWVLFITLLLFLIWFHKIENIWSFHIKLLCYHLFVLNILACNELLCICCHSLVPAGSLLFIPTQSGWVCCILNSSFVFLQYLQLVQVSLLPAIAVSNVLFFYLFFHGVENFTLFCGLDYCFLGPLCPHLSGPC